MIINRKYYSSFTAGGMRLELAGECSLEDLRDSEKILELAIEQIRRECAELLATQPTEGKMICFLIGLACVLAVVIGIPLVLYVIGMAANLIDKKKVPASEIGYHVAVGSILAVAGIVVSFAGLFIHWLGCVIHG